MIEITCCLCSKISTSVDQLESHLALQHFNSTPYQCEACLNSDQLSFFPTEASIKDHIYRMWSSPEADRERAEIRKCIDKSVETSMTRTQSPPAAYSCEYPFISLTSTTPTNDANGHSRTILEHNNEPDSNIRVNSLCSSGPTSEEYFKTEPDLPLTQVKREPISFMSANDHSREIFEEFLEQSNGNIETDHPDSSSMDGLASEEHLPAMTEDTSTNIADLINALNTKPDLPLSQIKQEPFEPMSFVSEREDMDTFYENLDESDDQRMNWLSHRSPTVSQFEAMEMNSATKEKAAKSFPDQSMQSVQNIRHSQSETSSQNRRASRLMSVKCSECAAVVINDASVMKRHMNTRHVKLPIHTCKVCDKVFYTGESNLALKHVHNAHKGDLDMLIDQKAANWAALNDHLVKYFPDASIKRKQNPVQKETVQCIECQEWIMKKTVSLKLHINIRHLHFALYHCRPCNIDFCGSLKQVRLHVNNHHKGEKDVIDNSQIEVNWNRLNSRISHFFPTFRAEHFKTRSKTFTKIRLKRLQVAKANLDTAPSKNSAKPHKKGFDPVMSISEPYREQIFMDRKLRQKKLRCNECKENVSRKLDYTLLNHVNLKHLRLPVFQCTACQMTFSDYSGGTAKKHANLHHEGDTAVIRDSRGEYYEEIQQKCVQVFGPKMNAISNTN